MRPEPAIRNPSEAVEHVEHNIRFRGGSGMWVVDMDLSRTEPGLAREDAELFGPGVHAVSRLALDWPDGSFWRGPWTPLAPEGGARRARVDAPELARGLVSEHAGTPR